AWFFFGGLAPLIASAFCVAAWPPPLDCAHGCDASCVGPSAGDEPCQWAGGAGFGHDDPMPEPGCGAPSASLARVPPGGAPGGIAGMGCVRSAAGATPL